jgi:hypothetical protein
VNPVGAPGSPGVRRARNVRSARSNVTLTSPKSSSRPVSGYQALKTDSLALNSSRS